MKKHLDLVYDSLLLAKVQSRYSEMYMKSSFFYLSVILKASYLSIVCKSSLSDVG